MKRLFAAMLCLCLLAGCGGKGSTGDTCRTAEAPGESMVSDTMGGSGEKAVSAGIPDHPGAAGKSVAG